MTKDELLILYEDYPDDELLLILQRPEDYSAVALEAAKQIVAERGGVHVLVNTVQQASEHAAERARIEAEVRQLRADSGDDDFVYKMMRSEILPLAELTELITATLHQLETEREDRAIKPRTITGGVLAASVASVVGGVLWGLQIMWSGRIFYIFVVGLVLLCYGTIRVATKQTHRNNLVVLLTVGATIVAMIIGQIMWEVFGRQ